MGTYKEVDGDLILMGKQGTFDVIAHGCNCFCKMGRGIAPQMAEAFGCDRFNKEGISYKGDINKLGQIDWSNTFVKEGEIHRSYLMPKDNVALTERGFKKIYIVNAYTQYHWDTQTKPFDYDAFVLCMRKMNYIFKGKHIGLPRIGAGLAGGDWEVIKDIIKKELKDCKVTVVNYNGK